MTTSIVSLVARVKGQSRQEKAAATRRRMLDAAYELFCSDGFRTTTMEAIAEQAGVAVQTLYFTFHTKDELLQEVHERTVLGDENLPPPMQPWYVAAVAAEDVRDAVRHVCRGVLSISRRVAPMIPVFHAVAGDPAGAVWERSQQMRHDGMVALVAVLTKKSRLRKIVSKDHAADVLYLLLGPDLYWTMVLGRGWTERQLSNWTERVVLDDLFGIEPARKS
jgi:AcrR family transcriptional regulator